ncbi:MAG: YraN family protein [Candidatus Vogelbacteria bacterium]|nr:YraN family protein [Candidatus Vogelbacteria bacterium]
MKTEKREIGDKGEDLSAMFLMKQGHKIVARNCWKPWGEIDIVTKKDGYLHFVEVKTVIRDLSQFREDEEYSPFDNITFDKKKRISRAIKTFLLENREFTNADWQADVIAVYLDKNSDKHKIDFLEDIDL